MVKTVIRRVKLMVPPADLRAVPRPRLDPMLDQVAMFPLTVVCAPTGFGKTSLVADWVRARDRRTAWYALDESDNALDVFAAGIASTLKDADPDVGSTLQANLQFDGKVSPVDCAAWLCDDLAESPNDLTLVLDDLHVIDHPDITLFLRELLRYPRPSFHLVILTQAALPFDVEPMRRRGLVGEVGAGDLAFADSEARAYLRGWPTTQLPEQTIDELVRGADGWISALKLGALAAASSVPGPDAELPPAWGQQRLGESLEVLCDDLMEHWSPEFLDFMIAIATPDRISPSLAEAIAPEWQPGQRASTKLREISEAGLFLLPVDRAGEWYRFHSLFRRALLQHAHDIMPRDRWQTLNRRIALWFEARGEISEAIRFMLAADDPVAAAALAAGHVQQALAFDQWIQVEQWMRLLPEAQVTECIDLLIARAWVLQARGQHDALGGVLATARALVSRQPPDDVEASWAELGLIETFAWSLRSTHASPAELFAAYRRAFQTLRGTGRFGELVAIQYYLLALSRVDPHDADVLINDLLVKNAGQAGPFSQLRVLWARVAQLLIYGSTGNATVMLDLSRVILSLAVKLDSPRQIALGQFFVASILFEIDELEEAERLFRAASTNPYAGIRSLVGSEVRLAYTLDAMGRTEEADEVLQRSLDRLLDADALDFVTAVRTAHLRLAIRRGDSDQAERLVRTLGKRPHGDYATELEIPSLAIATWLVQTESPQDADQADAILTTLEQEMSQVHWRSPRIQVIAVRALWHARCGNRGDEARLVAEAVSMTEEAGYVRVFSSLGPAGVSMLQRYRDAHGPWPYLDEILSRMRIEHHPRLALEHVADVQSLALARTVAALGNVPVYGEPLTQRELDILHGLQARFTNKEIAEELSISPLTVKSHTRNIYSKLGVNGRRQAIVRASALGLLSQAFPPDR